MYLCPYEFTCTMNKQVPEETRVSGGYELPGVGVKKLMPCLLIHPSIPYSTLLNDLKVETVKEYEVLNPSYSYSLWSSIHIDYTPVENTKTKK